jgi:hypothetical protein
VLDPGLLLVCAQPKLPMPTTMAVATAETTNPDAFMFYPPKKS